MIYPVSSRYYCTDSDESGVFFSIGMMDFLEKDLEEILKNTPPEKLVKSGLTFFGKKCKVFNQVRIGNYGIADMVIYNRYNNRIYITVVELKKEKIGIAAFLQTLSYARGIKSYFQKRGYFDFPQDNCMIKESKSFYYTLSIKIVLIGRTLDTNGAFCYLTDLMPDRMIEFYTYKYEFEGIKFKKEEGYILTDEGF